MPGLRSQYFLSFAVMGAVLPFLPVYLSRRGLTDTQIGIVMATQGVAVLLTPPLVTLLADLHQPARRLLRALFMLITLALMGLWAAHGFWALLLAHAAYSLAVAPIMPVQDGLTFHLHEGAGGAGAGAGPSGSVSRTRYHRVRVWGTVGYILPSVVLWFVLGGGADLGWALGVAAVLAVLAALNAGRLPGRSGALTREESTPLQPGSPRANGATLPTVEALRTLFRPGPRAFCLAMWLLHLTAGGYYAFYPRYLIDRVGFSDEYLGLISSVGVTLEIAYVLAFGLLLRRFGLRTLMAVGAMSIAVRFALLAAFPNPFVAIATQAGHGALVLVIHIAPPVYLNSLAHGRTRHSIHGVFAMTIYGTARIVGTLLAGPLAEWSLTGLFWVAAAVAGLATVLIAGVDWDRAHHGDHHDKISPESCTVATPIKEVATDAHR